MAKQEKSSAEKYREERKERLAKAAKKNAKKSHKVHLTKPVKAVISVVLVLAIVGGIGFYAYENSATKQQKIVAVKYMDTDISKPVYSYYYNGAFSNVFNTSYQYDSYGAGMGKMYTGFDYTVAPNEQAYPYAEELEGYENPTWSDYFDYTARETIKQVETYCNLAKELGLTLDEDDQKEIDDNIASIEGYAEQSSASVGAYLSYYYGKGVTKKLVTELMNDQLLAQKYMEHKKQEYKDAYTDEEIEKYYTDNKDSYDIVSIRYFNIAADKVTVDKTADDGTVTQSEETNDETMAAALEKANAFADAVEDDATFKAQAAEVSDSDEYISDDTKTLYDASAKADLSSLSEDALKWAFDGAKKGETYVEKVEGTGYNVYMISVPAGKDMSVDKTYDVRHILIKFPEEETTETTTEETTEATTEAVETTAEGEEAATVADTTAAEETTVEETTAETTTLPDVQTLDITAFGDTVIDLWVDADSAKDKQTYKKAQDILKEYLDGDKSEDSFAALATKYSEDHQDGEEVVDGGLYADVEADQMVAEFNDWCLDDSRKAGDVGIVETSYGYHVMYSVATNENGVSWEYNVMTDMADEDFNEYAETLLADEKYAVTDVDAAAVQEVADFTVSLSKKQLSNIQNSSSAG